MRRVYASWKPRHPLLAWCGFLLLLGVLALLLNAVLPEGGFSWRLWGFETHSFTVGDAEINMRLDTSGSGRYGVELSEDTICILRDGETILEGFFPVDGYEALEQEVLTDGESRIIEHLPEAPSSLLFYHRGEEGYVFLAQIEGASSATLFFIYGDVTEEEALDRVHRLQFTLQN